MKPDLVDYHVPTPGTAGNDEWISEREAPISSVLANSETEPHVPTEM